MKARIFLSLLLVSSMVLAESPGWRRAKNTADDVIYSGKDRTFYCGCVYTSHGDNDGSGAVSHTACGYVPPTTHIARATRVEWEHVVPASLMPANSTAGSLAAARTASARIPEHRPCFSTCTTSRLGRAGECFAE